MAYICILAPLYVISSSPSALDALRIDIHQQLTHGTAHPEILHKTYTYACLLASLAAISRNPTEEEALKSVERLDMSIIVAGAAGKLDLILDLIEAIQKDYLPLSPFGSPTFHLNEISTIHVPTASKAVVQLASPPSLHTFQQKCSKQPFVLRGYIQDWPALNEHSWSSPQYLDKVAGRGRVVPVEVGGDYRTEDWGQRIVPWHEFLQLSPDVYLAQHDLFRQFPALRNDIVVPDYAYASLSAPGYSPPSNDDQLVTNVWFGPASTYSPAHTVSRQISNSTRVLSCRTHTSIYTVCTPCPVVALLMFAL